MSGYVSRDVTVDNIPKLLKFSFSEEKYCLLGVVILIEALPRRSETNSGHYKCLIERNNTWYEFDDLLNLPKKFNKTTKVLPAAIVYYRA